MRISTIQISFLALLVSASSVLVAGRKKKSGNRKLGSQNKNGRKLGYDDTGKKCDECHFDLYYVYEENLSGVFKDVISGAPSECVLAAIRDHASRKGAQSAIPPGRTAMTQGNFPLDDYVEECHFAGEGTEKEVVASCGEHNYHDFFVNYEDSSVPSSSSIWEGADFPVAAGLIHAALTSNGTLVPVSQFEGWDGAVYECCPDVEEVCNEEIPEEDTST